jgi:hypothetical protein
MLLFFFYIAWVSLAEQSFLICKIKILTFVVKKPPLCCAMLLHVFWSAYSGLKVIIWPLEFIFSGKRPPWLYGRSLQNPWKETCSFGRSADHRCCSRSGYTIQLVLFTKKGLSMHDLSLFSLTWAITSFESRKPDWQQNNLANRFLLYGTDGSFELQMYEDEIYKLHSASFVSGNPSKLK